MRGFSDFEHLLRFDQDVLREIVRDGERRLDVQLATAQAADQRALSFLGFIVAGITASVSAAVAMVIGESPKIPLVILAFLFSISLCRPAFTAMKILRPNKFSFPGNKPENWFADDWNFDKSQGRGIKQALVEECYCINQAISKNEADLECNAKKMQSAFDYVVYSIFIFGLSLIFYAIYQMIELWSC